MRTEIQAITKDRASGMLSLQVGTEQKGFIDTVRECLEEARRERRLIPLGLYIDGEPAGFAMYGLFEGQVWLDHYLIDRRFQGKGMGRHFFMKILEKFQTEHPASDMYLSVAEKNDRAIHLYRKAGFRWTGEWVWQTELLMKREAAGHESRD